MVKRLIDYFGSREFSISITKSGVAYVLWLALLWAVDMKPGVSYMIWWPFAGLAFFFLVNILISFFTQTYAYRGNLVFHAAFLVVAAGALISAFMRFEGNFMLREGDVFFGEERQYLYNNAGDDFQKVAPRISFKLRDIKAELWQGRLHFIDLNANIAYPAETLENSGYIRLNDGIRIDGAKLRISDFKRLPTVTIAENGFVVFRGGVPANLFPTGSEGVFSLKGYDIYVSIPSDDINSKVSVDSAPVFKVRIEWLGKTIYSGLAAAGSMLQFGDMAISFDGVESCVVVAAVKDPGEPVVFCGLGLGLVGLALRASRVWVKRT